jgi:hypothetical protein
MALQMPFTDSYGVTHASAYWHINVWSFNKPEKVGLVRFNVWTDAAAYAAGKDPIPNTEDIRSQFMILSDAQGDPVKIPSWDTITAAMETPEIENPGRKYLYDLAKTFPEWDGAIDC